MDANKMAEGIGKVFDVITERLSSPSKEIFNFYVQHNIQVGIIEAIVGVLSLIIAITLLVNMLIKNKVGDTIILIVLSTIFGFIMLSWSYLDITNPQYYAIKEIIHQIQIGNN